MFDVIKNVISHGGISLAEVIKKIDYSWVRGYVTDDEREQLLCMARDSARPEDSMAPTMDRLAVLESMVKDVSDRLARIEYDLNGTEPPDVGDYPEFVRPIGSHDAYRVGDGITWQGRRYVCVYDGANWDPGEYPAAWQEVTDIE
jgi:hypothetical protein